MIAMDSEQRIEFSLASDRDKPDATRPVFVGRYLTCREMVQFDGFLAAASSTEEATKRHEALAAGVLLGLVDWRGVAARCGAPIEFRRETAADVLLDTLTPSELAELAYGLANAMVLTERDAKKSDSPSPSSSNESAADAVD